MDIRFFETNLPVDETNYWQRLSDSRAHHWHGTLPALIAAHRGENALDLFDVIDGALMNDLGLAIPEIVVATPKGDVKTRCAAVQLTFGRTVDLAVLWTNQGLSDLLTTTMLKIVPDLVGYFEPHISGVERPSHGKQAALGVTKTGNFAFTVLEDFFDPTRPLVHVIIPSITCQPPQKWMFIDPRFWLANHRIMSDIFDTTMLDGYARAIDYYGLGSMPRQRSA